MHTDNDKHPDTWPAMPPGIGSTLPITEWPELPAGIGSDGPVTDWPELPPGFGSQPTNGSN